MNLGDGHLIELLEIERIVECGLLRRVRVRYRCQVLLDVPVASSNFRVDFRMALGVDEQHLVIAVTECRT